MSFRLCVLLTLLAGSVWLVRPAQADHLCPADGLIRQVIAGDKALKAGETSRAYTLWKEAAAAGFAPAVRRIAGVYAQGEKPGDARLMAMVAAQLGDLEASRALDGMGLVAGTRLYEALGRKAANWRPERAGCWTHPAGKHTRAGARHLRHSDGFDIKVSDRLPADLVDPALRDMLAILALAGRDHPRRAVNLGILDGIDIIPGDRYDRYIGWRQGKDRHVLVLTVGNFLDETRAFVAEAILRDVTRRVYAQVPGSTYNDPQVRTIAGLKVYGSAYPDIKNERFFDALEKVLAQTEGLPPEVRKAVEIVDEIRYAPVSKHYIRKGLVDAVVGYYKQDISFPGNRVIFIRRNIRFGSRADLLLTLVHEGTHVLQDIEAGKIERDILRTEKIARSLSGDDPERQKIRQQLNRMKAHINAWRGRTPRSEGTNPGLRFECEATLMEIAAARALDIPPRRVESSQYLRVCKDARQALIRWKNSR